VATSDPASYRDFEAEKVRWRANSRFDAAWRPPESGDPDRTRCLRAGVLL